jgi:ethylbenzene dioxygenase alpha subunit
MRAAHERSGLAAPQVKGAMRLAGLRGFSPSDAFEQDGMDNRQECHRTCHGIVSRRHALNMQRGLGHEDYSVDHRAWASNHRFSDSNYRRFYRRWAQLMAAKSWAEIERQAGTEASRH